MILIKKLKLMDLRIKDIKFTIKKSTKFYFINLNTKNKCNYNIDNILLKKLLLKMKTI